MTIPNSTNTFYTQASAPQKSTIQQEAKSSEVTAQTDISQLEENNKTKNEVKSDFFDKISEKVINPKDINDTVKMPRTIFKGYLSFMIGSTLMFMANPIKEIKGFKTISKFLNFAGLGATIVGTYEFVKPFLLKPKNETKEQEKTDKTV